MITNFEEITEQLTLEEKATAKKILSYLQVGKVNAIKSPEIEKRFKINGPRLRKCMNYLRRTQKKAIIATSRGYYISRDRREIESFVASMRERAEAILAVANAMDNRL